jgi:hypothetical protein
MYLGITYPSPTVYLKYLAIYPCHKNVQVSFRALRDICYTRSRFRLKYFQFCTDREMRGLTKPTGTSISSMEIVQDLSSAR